MPSRQTFWALIHSLNESRHAANAAPAAVGDTMLRGGARPHGNNPDESIMECMFFSPYDERAGRPPAAPVHRLGADDDWTEAPELGMLARVFNQDTFNLPRVQRGLHITRREYVQFGEYGETKIRHFHKLLQRWLSAE